MGYDFEIDGQRELVEPAFGGDRVDLMIDGRRCRASLTPGSEPGERILELDGSRERIWIATRGDVHFIHLRGRAYRVEAINALERARHEADRSEAAELIRAPMPGVVVEVVVEPGVSVEMGQLLMTLESMKLQTAITAPHAAIVAEVCVSTGAAFDQGDVLIRLQAAEEENPR
jgi:biotin carboxyl carrier protein